MDKCGKTPQDKVPVLTAAQSGGAQKARSSPASVGQVVGNCTGKRIPRGEMSSRSDGMQYRKGTAGRPLFSSTVPRRPA